MLELAFRADPVRPEPLYEQLAGYLDELISAGRMIAGERLPASRELASQLGLSRNTVCHAYQILTDREVLRSHVGQGTFVAARSAALTLRPDEAPALGPAARSFAWEGLVADRNHRIVVPTGFVRHAAGSFDFRGGAVDPALLPLAELRRAWSRALESSLDVLSRPLDPRGLPALREEIALSLVARGIACELDDVLVTTGIHQSFDLVARALLDPGDTVAVEQPGYFGASMAFRASGARLVAVPVDAEGLRVDELARVLGVRRVKLVYTTPSAQSPTGAMLSEERRDALLELSDRYQLPIFEDDYDSELRYDSPPLPALKTRDPAGRVVYAGTFSKALFPGLRVGYLVAARPLLKRLSIFKSIADFSTDGVAQAAGLELQHSGALERHVRRVRRVYPKRRDAMLDALERHMPSGARWTRPQGGHAVWLTLPPDVDAAALQQEAVANGILYGRGDVFSIDESFSDHASLSFVSQDEDVIEEGIAALGGLVARYTGR
jgi:GntR family transcriptional regulator/MocR family aminotransferase